MAIFENLSEKLNHIFSKLKNKGALTELEIKQAMREVRVALLSADVNFNVVKEFINKVSEKAVGEDILKSLSPAQQVIKIVNEELIALMGSEHSRLGVSDRPPTVILMCGLQGSGKTTMCGKLAHLLKKQGKHPLLVACDIYRPAAIQQLIKVGSVAGAEVFEKGTQDPRKTVKQAIEHATSNRFDTVIVDTAGRLQIDEPLMKELRDLKEILNPTEILLVIDSTLGQEAVNVSQEFNRQLDVTGIVLSKLDGDTRGGAALSVKAVTGKPIKFCSVGEKVNELELFYPDRMASRILGMGDVLTLIEKAEQAYTEEEAKRMEQKMRTASFDFQDYLEQIDKLKKMGNLSDMVGMIPGMANKLKGQSLEVDEVRMKRMKAIILSMTPEERHNPDLLKGSRKKRIVQGSGTTIQEVNQLIKQFEATRDMMKRMSGGGKRKRYPF